MSEQFREKTKISLTISNNYMGKNYSGDPEEKWETSSDIVVEVTPEKAVSIFRKLMELLSKEE